MKSHYAFNIANLSHELAIYDERKDIFYTLEFTAHKTEKGNRDHVTSIRDIPEMNEILNALAQCLIKMGIVQDSATEAELKAVKYHLEDFRKLVFK